MTSLLFQRVRRPLVSALALAIMMCGTASMAQFYQTVNKNRADWFYTYDSLAPSGKKIVRLAVNPATIDIVAGDSIMYLRDEFDGTTRFNSQQPSCPLTKSRTWAGDAVNRRFRDNVYINKDGWSFTLKWNVPVGGSFQFNSWNTDSIRMRLTLVRVDYLPVNGQQDSARVFMIQRVDNSGNVVPHKFNGKTMIVSKSHGWVKTYSMRNFPHDTNAYYRMSPSVVLSPRINLGLRDVWSMQAGDQFHFVTKCYACAGPTNTTAEWKRTITSVNSTAAGILVDVLDSIKYIPGNLYIVAQRQIMANWSADGYLDSASYAQHIITPASGPRERTIMYQRLDSLGISYKVVDSARWYQQTTGSTCFTPGRAHGLVRDRYYYRAGGPYQDSPAATDELVYMKMNGGISLGTPLNWGNVTNLAAAVPRQYLRAWPSPASDVLHLEQGNANMANVVISDQLGRNYPIIWASADHTALNVSALPNGIYTLVAGGKAATITRFTILR